MSAIISAITNFIINVLKKWLYQAEAKKLKEQSDAKREEARELKESFDESYSDFKRQLELYRASRQSYVDGLRPTAQPVRPESGASGQDDSATGVADKKPTGGDSA